MIQGTYSAQGFRVVAGNALELVTGTQAASAGYIAENVKVTGQVLHNDLARISGDILSSNEALREVNQSGFDAVRSSIDRGNTTAGALGAINLAVQAAGFIAVSNQLSRVNGEIGLLRREFSAQATEMARLQGLANAKLESLVQVAERTLQTQERILEALVQSRAGEAQQLIRQGWENLRHGYRDDAASRFERSLEYDNTVYISHAMLADICRERKESAKAEAHYQRAVAFSSDKGPDIKAHAHMQYAAFLEEAQRFPDAVRQVEQALAIHDRPTWRFFMAELQIAAGEVSAGLATLRAAIEADSNIFPAVLMSARLSQQEGMAAFLVEVDGAVRGPLLDELARLKSLLGDLSAAAARLHPPGQAPSLDDLQAREAELLQAIARSPFQELKALQEPIRLHAQALETRAAQIGDSLVPALLEIGSRFGALSKLMPSMQDQAEAMGSIAAPVQASEHGIIFIVAGIAAFAGVMMLSTTEGGMAAVLLVVAVAIAGLGVNAKRREAARHKAAAAAPRAKASSVLVAWQNLLHEQAALGREFTEAKDRALSRLAAAKGEALWPSARAHLKALAQPLALTPPSWVLERSTSCKSCGTVCRSGSPACPRCGNTNLKTPESETQAEAGPTGAAAGTGEKTIVQKLGPWVLGLTILAGVLVAAAKVRSGPARPVFRYSGAACNCAIDFPCDPQVQSQPNGAVLAQCQDAEGRTFKLWSEVPKAEALGEEILIPSEGMDSQRFAQVAAAAHYDGYRKTAGAQEDLLTKVPGGAGPGEFKWSLGTGRLEGRFFYGNRGYQFLSVWYDADNRPSMERFFESFKRLADEPERITIYRAESSPSTAPAAAAVPAEPEAGKAPVTHKTGDLGAASHSAAGLRCVRSVVELKARFEEAAKDDLGGASSALLRTLGGGGASPIEKSDWLLRTEVFTRAGAPQGSADVVLQVVSQAGAGAEGAEYHGTVLAQFRKDGEQYCLHNLLAERLLHCWADKTQAVTFDWIEGGIAVERVQVESCGDRRTFPLTRTSYIPTEAGVSVGVPERRSRGAGG